ncbi:MAG: DUF447 domain-containing protein [Burkholderiales bacterium]
MIYETVVTTQNLQGQVHIAPMGVKEENGIVILAPFKPSTTLENILATRSAVVNLTDDVRVIAGCLTGRRDWPTVPADQVNSARLRDSLVHRELTLEKMEEGGQRPRLLCKCVKEVVHAPFKGFNRAQAAVVEGAILASRLHMLPCEKIESEMKYHAIAIEKTAGPREREAWTWLLEKIAAHKVNLQTEKTA